MKSRAAHLLGLFMSHSLPEVLEKQLPPESPGELYVAIGRLKQAPPLVADECSRMPAVGWPALPLVPF